MMHKSGFFMASAATLCFILASCSLAPDMRKPSTPLPENWQLSGQNSQEQSGTWWDAYNDEKLNALIAEALAYNSDIQLASARVEEARAIAGSARANRMPNVTAGGAASRGDVNLDGLPSSGATDGFAVGGLLSYEIDLWGRLANADKAAREQLLAEEASARAVVLGVSAETASNYFATGALNEQIAITQKTIKTRKGAYDLEKKRLDRGDVDSLIVRQAEAELTSAQARLPALEQQRELRLSSLSVLLGKTPKQIMESEVFAGANKTILPDLPSLPQAEAGDVIAARPDIIAAEHRLTAANANIGVAKAAYLPRLSVSGLLGVATGDWDALFDGGSKSWNMGANATVPLLDFGRARAQVDAASAREKQAYIGYEKTVRVAFREIKDALVTREKTVEKSTILDKRVAVLRESASLARKRFDAGYSGYIDVLDAERSLFDSEIAKIEAKQQKLQSSIDLSKALGGGI
ncbi:MAG: RND transporter [Micavibrio aeruginosavorus]|uniref:RND transporter n=1 Tax=Micavibrio aeruginosavorus TaxID=349221 RepID=A0A2W5FK88_9BACT|nr:MAG: RND transporter [Micavibrio aeruginosavorus]PZP56361.1 MAG: RND transporter [Micavibrio aeruginosavorus]